MVFHFQVSPPQFYLALLRNLTSNSMKWRNDNILKNLAEYFTGKIDFYLRNFAKRKQKSIKFRYVAK